jgi:hypothetical protein
MLTSNNPFPESIGPCDDNCTAFIEHGISCYHKCYEKLSSAIVFTKWEVYPPVRLQQASIPRFIPGIRQIFGGAERPPVPELRL